MEPLGAQGTSKPFRVDQAMQVQIPGTQLQGHSCDGLFFLDKGSFSTCSLVAPPYS